MTDVGATVQDTDTAHTKLHTLPVSRDHWIESDA